MVSTESECANSVGASDVENIAELGKEQSSIIGIVQSRSRLGRIRRVETSAQADLEHGGVHPGVAESAQRGGGHHLEKRRMRRERSAG